MRSDTSNGTSGVRHTCTIDSPVGGLELLATDGMLNHIHFVGDAPRTQGDVDDDPVLRATVDQLTAYFAGELVEFDLPLAPRGTAFQERVWSALQEIPYAEPGRTPSSPATSACRPRSARSARPTGRTRSRS